MSTRQDKETIRQLLIENMFDGDPDGRVTMGIPALVEDVAEIISAHYILQPKKFQIEQ